MDADKCPHCGVDLPAAKQDGHALIEVVVALKRACDEGLIVNPPGLHSDAVGVLLDAANDALAAKSAAPVPFDDGMLPAALVPHAKEWYRLCERRFYADRIPISGELTEAIVEAFSSAPAVGVVVEAVAWLSKEQAQLALFEAIRAIKLGNPTDDKLILKNLRDAGLWIGRREHD